MTPTEVRLATTGLGTPSAADDDLIARDLRRPGFLIVDGAPRLDKAIRRLQVFDILPTFERKNTQNPTAGRHLGRRLGRPAEGAVIADHVGEAHF